ncbi:MAG: YdcF family protein [Flavobacteriales bacterium]|nr:YdcF family protein [Flavobacteriales bacterium]
MYVVIAFSVASGFLLAFLHPYFAIDRPVEARTLVVEGWMPHQGLAEAARIFLNDGYDRLLVTGTDRPFSRYLRNGDTLFAEPGRPLMHGLIMELAGLPSASWILRANGDTLGMAHAHPGVVRAGPFSRKEGAITRICLVVHDDEPKAGDPPVLFIRDLSSDGGSIAHWMRNVRIVHPDRREEGGWPTYAHEAAAVLEEAGVPRDRMVIVPAREGNGGRTWANAQAIAATARRFAITHYNVATLGVHARRTWMAYRHAAGPGNMVGVLSMDDPDCRSADWWLHPVGLSKVFREVIGSAREMVEDRTWKDADVGPPVQGYGDRPGPSGTTFIP